MKAMFQAVMVRVRFLISLALIGVAFYSGMYVMAFQQNPEDAKAAMVSNLEEVFRNTSDQPIIMIVPEHSMFEKAKAKIGMDLPERETVVISTRATKHMVGYHDPIKPGMVQTALTFWGDKADSAGESIKSGWSWWSDKITFLK